MNYNPKVTEYINSATSEQIEVLEQLRELIHKSVEGLSEEIKWGIPVFIKTKIFSYLRVSKNHIALGFYNIDRIKDSEGILEGSGKTMRHLKIKNKEEIEEELIEDWLKLTAD